MTAPRTARVALGGFLILLALLHVDIGIGTTSFSVYQIKWIFAVTTVVLAIYMVVMVHRSATLDALYLITAISLFSWFGTLNPSWARIVCWSDFLAMAYFGLDHLRIGLSDRPKLH